MSFIKSLICLFKGHRPAEPYPFYCSRCRKYWFQYVGEPIQGKEITSDMVKALQKESGEGMLRCKKALIKTNGDHDKAFELLRINNGEIHE